MAVITNAAGTNIAAVDASGQIAMVLPATQVVNLPETQQIVARDERVAIAMGLIPGAKSQDLHGYNEAIGTSFEPLVSTSNATYPIVNTPITLTLSSDAVTDVYGTGTGARAVMVTGVTTGFVEVSEIVNLNGRTGVSTVNTYLAVNSVTVVAAGSNGSNNGGIYAGFGAIILGVPANILASIVATQNTSTGAIYTVPAGKTWVISLFSGSFTGGGVLQFRLRNNLGLTYIDRTIPIPTPFFAVLPAAIPMVIPEKTQVQVWGKATTTAAGATIFQGVLYTN